MYAAGVTCSDCHNAHTGKLRVEGNNVCTHCHLPAAFDAPLHTKHQAGTDAAKCTSCHMTTKTYMVVDPRYDHSFRVPRVDYTQQYGIPNACTTPCHTDKSVAWANKAIVKWYGPTRTRGNEYVAALNAGRRDLPDAEAQLSAAVTNKDLPGIARATALSHLRNVLTPASVPALQAGIADPEPIVRAAAAQALEALPPASRVEMGRRLLNDPVRLVRAWTASALAGVPPQALPPGVAGDLDRATAEYLALELAVAERPEAHINLSGFYLRQGKPAEAEKALQDALRIDPKSVPARVNLADVYRAMGREADGARALEAAIALDPKAAEALHALGLLYVRQKRQPEALTRMKQAYELQPRIPRYGYVYAVALQSGGDINQAVAVLEAVNRAAPADRDTLMALALFERDRGNIARATFWAATLVQMRPQDTEAGALLAELKGGR